MNLSSSHEIFARCGKIKADPDGRTLQKGCSRKGKTKMKAP